MNCEHAVKGCDAVLDHGALQKHIQNCHFMPVTCSNEGCLEVVCKCDVRHHELELCCFKKVTCDYCGKKIQHHKYGAHGCVLRRDVDEMKKDLAEMKSTIETLDKSCRNVSNAVNAMRSDIIVIGGSDSHKRFLFSVERFNLFNQTWTQMPELQLPRFGFAAVLFENQILACGGSTDPEISTDPTDTIEVLDLNSNPTEWQMFSASLPIKVAGHKCVVVGIRLLIIGGGTEEIQALDTIYELFLVPPYSSKLLCHMKTRRVAHGAELFDDKVLIVGGHGTDGDIKTDVEIFDITRNECVEMPPLASPLCAMATVRRGDTMLLIGGTTSNDIVEYNLKTGESKVEVVMSTERVGSVAVYQGHTLVVAGGAKGYLGALPLDCYDFSTHSWRNLPAMSTGRFFASAVIVKKEFEF